MSNLKQRTCPLSPKLLSMNTKGLNIPEKRSQFLREFHKQKADIICIQETHFKSEKTQKFYDKRFPLAYHATNSDAKTKGVSNIQTNTILINRFPTRPYGKIYIP